MQRMRKDDQHSISHATTCLNCILEENGGSHNKIPRINKDRLEGEGTLRTVIGVCDRGYLHLGIQQ